MKFSLPGFHEFEKLNLWIIDRYNVNGKPLVGI